MINPVERYAKEEFPQDSITRLAEAADITYGTVHKTIQGLYSSIPVKLATYMAQNSDNSIEEWQRFYSLWVNTELAVLKTDIERGHLEATALFLSPARVKEAYPTFVDWRKSLSYSQIDFCKTFLMHQGILGKYESGQMVNLPVSLRERLRYLGMTDDYIKAVGDLPV